MKRRNFIALLGGAAMAVPFAVWAQRQTPRIGMLWHAGSAEEEGTYFTALMKGFADLGYVDGKTAHFEHRYANEPGDDDGRLRDGIGSPRGGPGLRSAASVGQIEVMTGS